jgi:hypothetical protein
MRHSNNLLTKIFLGFAEQILVVLFFDAFYQLTLSGDVFVEHKETLPNYLK